MATTEQKQAARRNIKRAQETQSERAQGKKAERKSTGMGTSKKNSLADSKFAFPVERKEPLNDAKHVRNAVARFDQVEGVTDAERDRAWKRILTAAKKFDVEVSARDWRELFKGGKAKKD